MDPSPRDIRNRLLALLPPEEFAQIARHLEAIDLPAHLVLSAPGVVEKYAYFLESGVGSSTVVSDLRRNMQFSLFGREGMTPVSAILGAFSDLHLTVMQVGGNGFRIEIEALSALLVTHGPLRLILGHYAHTVFTQVANAVQSEAVYQVEQRIARLVLMYHDRIDGNAVPLTHANVSAMLAIRRPTVTTVIQQLEGVRAIRATRGLITVLDRPGLELMAKGAYGPPEQEYRRLIGLMR